MLYFTKQNIGSQDLTNSFFFFSVLPAFDVGDIFSIHIFTVYIQCVVSIQKVYKQSTTLIQIFTYKVV